MDTERFDNIIVGGGLAGITTAIELLDNNKEVLIIDRDTEENFGGLAKKSFGGIIFSGTPEQKKSRIKDTSKLLYQDWMRYGDFDDENEIGAQWAKLYSEKSIQYIYDWLKAKKVDFLPVVNWPERGMHVKGNSVPRWHITWGTGYDLVNKIIKHLLNHPNKSKLTTKFNTKVDAVIINNNTVEGIETIVDSIKTTFKANNVVISSGGITGGNLDLAKKHWNTNHKLPDTLLNGSHKYADGLLHLDLEKKGAKLSNLNKQWHYAAGIPTPKPEEGKFNDGLSLVPPRSAIWVDAKGKRFSPSPLVAYTDTSFMVEQILKTEEQYSWSIMNWKIAINELAVSGSEYMTAFKERDKFTMIKDVLFGNKKLINRLISESDHFVVADNIEELVEKMNAQTGDNLVSLETLKQDLQSYDDEIDRGKSYFNDEQLRRLVNFRLYRGDKIRTLKFQKILESKAGPLIAVKEYILSRKSLGGITTNLNSQVITDDNKIIEGLYATGEAAGFGGGGIHGKRSLEGTFLGACILTGRIAGSHISKNPL